jgi:hypothetical protein
MGQIPIDRRSFFRSSSGLLILAAFNPVRLRGPHRHQSRFEHPDPRPGITSEHVLTADALGERKEKVLSAYDLARGHPEIFDGLACACGCTGKNGSHRSFLSCFESMQPTGCYGCLEQAELIAPLIKDGKTLAEIRSAIDKKWG